MQRVSSASPSNYVEKKPAITVEWFSTTIFGVPPGTQHFPNTVYRTVQLKINNNFCLFFVSQLKCNAVNNRESHHTSPTTVTWLSAVLSLLPSTHGWGGGKVLSLSLPSDSFQSLKYKMQTSLIISDSSGRHKRVDSQRIIKYICWRKIGSNSRVNLRLDCTSEDPIQPVLSQSFSCVTGKWGFEFSEFTAAGLCVHMCAFVLLCVVGMLDKWKG